MSDDVGELIRELAGEHGVALDRSDPILLLHTATRKILQGALADAQAAQAAALSQHRSELELAASRWQDDTKRRASELLRQVEIAIGQAVAQQLDQMALTATARLQQPLERHEKALSRSTLTCALAAAVAMLAAGAFVWAGGVALAHPGGCGQSELSTINAKQPSE